MLMSRWEMEMFYANNGRRCFGWNLTILLLFLLTLAGDSKRSHAHEEYERVMEEGRVK